MTNEFIAKKGLISNGNATVAGDLSASGDLNLGTGSNTATIYTDGTDNLVLSSQNDIIFSPVAGGEVQLGSDATASLYSSNNDLYVSAVGDIVLEKNTTVTGLVCATGIVYGSNINSDNWDSVHTTVNDTSANWDSVYTTVNSNSATYANIKRTNVILASGTDTYDLALNQSSTTFVVSAPADGAVQFNLPAVTNNDLGTWYSLVKFATGTWITVSALNAKIDDSDINATVYSGSSAQGLSAGEQNFASIEIELVLPDQWHVKTGRKVWTTTQFV